MDSQLELLLEMQDLRAQKRELQQEEAREVESGVFDLQVEDALRTLDEKLEELESGLDPQVRSRYRQVAAAHPRPVVPVLNGICYGCFVAVPTAWSSGGGRNESIQVCDHCGRFLYHVS